VTITLEMVLCIHASVSYYTMRTVYTMECISAILCLFGCVVLQLIDDGMCECEYECVSMVVPALACVNLPDGFV
jgi:hypothetical protein